MFTVLFICNSVFSPLDWVCPAKVFVMNLPLLTTQEGVPFRGFTLHYPLCTSLVCLGLQTCSWGWVCGLGAMLPLPGALGSPVWTQPCVPTWDTPAHWSLSS